MRPDGPGLAVIQGEAPGLSLGLVFEVQYQAGVRAAAGGTSGGDVPGALTSRSRKSKGPAARVT